MKTIYRRTLSLCLLLTMMFSAATLVFSEKTGNIGNPSTFENIYDASKRVVAAGGAPYTALESYPQETTYIYRSSDRYGKRSFWRLNTCFLVFSESHFKSIDDAKALLDKTGLVELIEKIRGSVILVGPIGDTWGQADFDAYQKLQTMLHWEAVNDFGVFGFYYVIGKNEAATFIYNYIVPNGDDLSRIAGILAVGGEMTKGKATRGSAPVYLAAPPETAVTLLKSANSVNPKVIADSTTTIFINDRNPAQKVIIDTSNKDFKSYIAAAYETLFKRTMRLPVVPGRDYLFDAAPFALSERIIPEEIGLTIIAHENGEKLAGTNIERWYEYIPSGTEGLTEKIPLILQLHGSDDDPRAQVEQNGWLHIAAKEKIIMVAPDHQTIVDSTVPASEKAKNKVDKLMKLVDYMIDKYPQVDPSRIYCTGFSLGGMATSSCAWYATERFAAVAPMGGMVLTGENDANLDELIRSKAEALDLPTFILSQDRDKLVFYSPVDFSMSVPQRKGLYYYQFLNDIEPVPFEKLDFAKYKFYGFPLEKNELIQMDDYIGMVSDIKNKEGIPMVRLVLVQGLNHALFQGHALPAWQYLKKFSRDPETKALIYSIGN